MRWRTAHRLVAKTVYISTGASAAVRSAALPARCVRTAYALGTHYVRSRSDYLVNQQTNRLPDTHMHTLQLFRWDLLNYLIGFTVNDLNHNLIQFLVD